MLLCFLCVGCSSVNDDTDNDSVERIVVGDDVPIFSVGVVDHGMLTTFSTGHLEGETVIVFFSTLCGDCKRGRSTDWRFLTRHSLTAVSTTCLLNR